MGQGKSKKMLTIMEQMQTRQAIMMMQMEHIRQLQAEVVRLITGTESNDS
jgi:hypothetical protein